MHKLESTPDVDNCNMFVFKLSIHASYIEACLRWSYLVCAYFDGGGGGGRFMSIHFSVTAKLLQNETHCCFGVQHATECGTRTDKALHIILPKLRNKEST